MIYTAAQTGSSGRRENKVARYSAEVFQRNQGIVAASCGSELCACECDAKVL